MDPDSGSEGQAMGLAVSARKRRVVQALRVLRERKREKLAKLAWELDFSYKYFKYAVLPELKSITECIEYDKTNDELIWVCDGEGVA